MWIRAYKTLGRHPKLQKFARLLGVSIPTAVGHMQLFWFWVSDYAPDGNITDFSPEDIADAAQWDGDPEVFFNALLNCGPGRAFGFVERDGDTFLVHDWDDAQGVLYRRRQQNADHKREVRKQQKIGQTSKERQHDVSMTHSTCQHDVRREKRERRGEEREERDENNTLRSPEATKEGEADAKTQQTRQKFQELADAWNTSLAPLGFPKVLKPTPGRMKAFAARLEVAPERESLGWWTQNVLKTMAASEFLTQEARKGANWLTLDWVLNENNLVKVLEGKYSRTQQRTQKPQTVQDAWDNIETDYDKAMQRLRELRGEYRRDYIDVEATERDKAGLSGVLPDNAGRRDSNGNAEWQDAGENDTGNVRYLVRLSG